MSGHEFVAEPDGSWVTAACVCGWSGLSWMYRRHACDEWEAHVRNASRDQGTSLDASPFAEASDESGIQPETTREEKGNR